MRQIHLTVLCLYQVKTVRRNRPLLTHALNLFRFASRSSLALGSGSLFFRRGKVAVLSSSNHGSFLRSARRFFCTDGFFALSMAHVFQTILSVDVKEKAIAALISTLKMVHSAPLLIIDATGTSNRLPSILQRHSEVRKCPRISQKGAFS